MPGPPPQNQGQWGNFGMPPGQFPMGYQQQQYSPGFNPYAQYMGGSYYNAFQQQQQNQVIFLFITCFLFSAVHFVI